MKILNSHYTNKKLELINALFLVGFNQDGFAPNNYHNNPYPNEHRLSSQFFTFHKHFYQKNTGARK